MALWENGFVDFGRKRACGDLNGADGHNRAPNLAREGIGVSVGSDYKLARGQAALCSVNDDFVAVLFKACCGAMAMKNGPGPLRRRGKSKSIVQGVQVAAALIYRAAGVGGASEERGGFVTVE